ncbi:restriction endonuclease [Rhodococcus aetherivorans]
MPAWKDYQEEVAAFFRDLGMDAQTDVTVIGARTSHDVDVLVESKHSGIEIRWLVECKAWNSRVPKEKVLALRSIVDDTGTDRGFIMAESGYQKGALEAALLSNVMLTSLGDLQERLRFEISMTQLRKLSDRLDECRDRYWNLDKPVRVAHKLKPEIPDITGYHGALIIYGLEAILNFASRRGFPMIYDLRYAMSASWSHWDFRPRGTGSENVIETPEELVKIVEPEITELERRLGEAEAGDNSLP